MCENGGQETRVLEIVLDYALCLWGYIALLVEAFFTPHLIVFVSSLYYLCIVYRKCKPFT